MAFGVGSVVSAWVAGSVWAFSIWKEPAIAGGRHAADGDDDDGSAAVAVPAAVAVAAAEAVAAEAAAAVAAAVATVVAAVGATAPAVPSDVAAAPGAPVERPPQLPRLQQPLPVAVAAAAGQLAGPVGVGAAAVADARVPAVRAVHAIRGSRTVPDGSRLAKDCSERPAGPQFLAPVVAPSRTPSSGG